MTDFVDDAGNYAIGETSRAGASAFDSGRVQTLKDASVKETAHNPLEGFLLLAKSTSGLGLTKLVEQVTGAPGVYVFGELLQLDNIKALAGQPETKPYFGLLLLFSTGVWKDYSSAAYPELGPGQTLKLKQLTLLTLAARHRVLTYAVLKEELGISSTRELENTVIDLVYHSAIQCRMDQQGERVQVHSAIGRDIHLNGTPPHETSLTLEHMYDVLSTWSQRIDTVLGDIQADVSRLREDDAAEGKEQSSYLSKLSRLVSRVEGPTKSTRPGLLPQNQAALDSLDKMADSSFEGGPSSTSTPLSPEPKAGKKRVRN